VPWKTHYQRVLPYLDSDFFDLKNCSIAKENLKKKKKSYHWVGNPDDSGKMSRLLARGICPEGLFSGSAGVPGWGLTIPAETFASLNSVYEGNRKKTNQIPCH